VAGPKAYEKRVASLYESAGAAAVPDHGFRADILDDLHFGFSLEWIAERRGVSRARIERTIKKLKLAGEDVPVLYRGPKSSWATHDTTAAARKMWADKKPVSAIFKHLKTQFSDECDELSKDALEKWIQRYLPKRSEDRLPARTRRPRPRRKRPASRLSANN